MPLYWFAIEQVAPYNHLLGTKQTVPAKQHRVCALFGTVLKQKPMAPSKALILFCSPKTICFVHINILFRTSCSILSLYMAHTNLKNKKTVAVKSKLKVLAYRPEVQQTDLTYVYETCQNSRVSMRLPALV